MTLHLYISCAAVALLCPAHAIAQSSPSTADVECNAAQAALERDMEAARSKGQMLRRRQLEEALGALHGRCGNVITGDEHRARVLRQEDEVHQRRLELERAEEELRRLRAEKP